MKWDQIEKVGHGIPIALDIWVVDITFLTISWLEIPK